MIEHNLQMVSPSISLYLLAFWCLFLYQWYITTGKINNILSNSHTKVDIFVILSAI